MSVMEQLVNNPELFEQFYQWKDCDQEEFLDVCTGTKGLKVVYDGVFKEIFNPDVTPERLEELLSLLLNRKVKIKDVLPNDGIRLGAETALIYTDILVELEDGTLCNVEIQRIGIAFPGARAACYSSNHLMRQHKRLRKEKGKRFTYRDIKKVYTIVFIEKSPKEFKKYPDHYIHWFHHVSDTGAELDLLQEYFFICLDIFKENMENRSISNNLEAWLSFLSFEDVWHAQELAAYDPKFKAMYQDLYDISRNTERVMQVFSKELAMLDRNTVRYMIDEMQSELELLKEEKGKLEAERQQVQAEAQQLKTEAQQLKTETQQLKTETQQLKAESQQLKAESQQKDIALQEKEDLIQCLQKELAALRK